MPTALSHRLPEILPPPVAERVVPVRDAAPPEGGFVLYWMRTAVRARVNPALDAALALGRELGRPVFVYHALAEGYPYASDRHHTFILEGARDVQADLAARGIGYAFHLERPGHRGPHLVSLGRRAAVVVTELMPVAPLHGWTRALAARIEAPVLTVDTACVVPMPLTHRAYDRAFAFRQATAAAREERLARPWHDVEPADGPFVPADLPFAPLDLAGADLPSLVAACEIDHTVAPVPHTRGGRRAGLARWRRFRDERLQRYHRDRNDPLKDGVSRLSPYLHYGHVSSLEIARDAAGRGGKGAEKYLDELLVWRELAYGFCFHRPDDHAGVGALPGWARRTLEEHAGDERAAIPPWETLARGKTGDALWDAAQRSLRIHGELHNNVRMTWGKALVGWSRDAAHAVERLVDLNHRFALDGRDPASYGGLFWCLGLFDRPFDPAKPVLGRLRPRSTADHARRLDVDAYARRTGRPALAAAPRVAVVGAGPAGMLAARTLADHGLAVDVFDKGRGPGGRTATRRWHDDAGAAASFDHGAQYFTLRDPRLAHRLRSWRDAGVVAPWRRRDVVLGGGVFYDAEHDDEHWVGVPGMSALVGHLGAGLDVRWDTRVSKIEGGARAWTLAVTGDDEPRLYDAVIVATPAPQVAPLLAPVPHLAERAAAAVLAPCWAVMAAWPDPLDLGFDCATVEDDVLAWAAKNDTKPGRTGDAAWVLHATPEWSEAHLDDDPGDVAEAMLAAFAGAVRRDLPPPARRDAHRWRWARVTEALGEDCLWDAKAGLGYCGDACLGPRVESALLSGAAVAGRLLGTWAAEERSTAPASEQMGLFDG